MTNLVYRNAGAWGPGKGSLLTSLEADTNFYNLDQGKLDKNNTNKVQGVDSANLIQNGTGEFGDTFWNSANFGWTKDLVSGSGTLFSLGSAITTGTMVEDVSEFIPVGPAVLLSLQGEIFTGPMTAGNAVLAFDCYDSSKTLIASSEFTTNNLQFGNSWQFCYGSGITPSNTAYVKVHKRAYNSPLAPAGGVKFRRIKLEANNAATAQYSIYSQEQSLYEVTSRMASLGECRFQYVSTTQCVLNRFSGSRLTINGRHEQIPAAGLTLANTGLAVNTLYYVYVFMNSGVMTLEAVTTGHSQDVNTGVEIKTGDPTRTLVGAAYTSSSSTFLMGGGNLLVGSWFNKRRVSTGFDMGSSLNFSNTSPAALGNGGTVFCWSGYDLNTRISARMQNSTAAALCVATQQWSGVGTGNSAVYQAFANNSQGDVMLTAQGSRSSDSVIGVRLAPYVSASSVGLLVTALGWLYTDL